MSALVAQRNVVLRSIVGRHLSAAIEMCSSLYAIAPREASCPSHRENLQNQERKCERRWHMS